MRGPERGKALDTLDAIARYFAAVWEDGDWLNDWLTHMPGWIADVVMRVGIAIAHAFGL